MSRRRRQKQCGDPDMENNSSQHFHIGIPAAVYARYPTKGHSRFKEIPVKKNCNTETLRYFSYLHNETKKSILIHRLAREQISAKT
jgi:hypothetical protein